jgi:hypothetical protein
MAHSSRRDFLAGTAALVFAGAVRAPAHAAMGPNDKFDLLVKIATRRGRAYRPCWIVPGCG